LILIGLTVTALSLLINRIFSGSFQEVVGIIVMGTIMFLVISAPVMAVVSLFSRPRQMPRFLHFWLELRDLFTYKPDYPLERPSQGQMARLDGYAGKWEKVFFSTTPADREKCGLAAHDLFQASGLAAPQVVWLDSPFQAVVALAILSVNGASDQYGARTSTLFPPRLNGRPYVPGSGRELALHRVAMSHLKGAVEKMRHNRTLVINKLRRDLYADPAGVWDAWGDVYERIMAQAPQLCLTPGEFEMGNEEHSVPLDWMRRYAGSMLGSVGMELEGGAFLMGRHGAPEMLEYEIAYKWRADELGAEYQLPPGFDIIEKASCELSQSCGWWMPLDQVAVLTEPPTAIRTDENGRLHAEGMAAVEYPDGWSVHAVNGTLLHAQWGAEAPERWKLDWILKTNNQEERRALLERMDYDRLLRQEKNAKLVHQDGDMRLYMISQRSEDDSLVFYENLEPVVLLQVTDPSTGAEYVLRVPPEMDNCERARRWTLHDETGTVKFIKET